jgi:phospholipid/cholesterol/gamma-HCH transport system substrate-binding protein
MTPVVRKLRLANRETRPFALDAAPRIRRDIRPFVREARPLVVDLAPAASKLAEATPSLTRTFRVINHFYNMLAYNPNGREGPEVEGREEGYLFHTGWLVHQVNNLFRNQDAHGPGRPVTYGGTCAIVANTLQLQPELEGLLGLTGALTDPLVCGKSGAGGGLGEVVPDLPLPRKGKASYGEGEG